jgi:hypothetical protein
VTKSFTGWQTSIRSKISRIPDLNARHLGELNHACKVKFRPWQSLLASSGKKRRV